MVSLLNEDGVQNAIDYLVNSSDEAAQARANRLHLEQGLKSKKAELMKMYIGSSLGAQEREALASAEYQEFLEAYKQAIFIDEKCRHKRNAAEALIEARRSHSANYRAMKI